MIRSFGPGVVPGSIVMLTFKKWDDELVMDSRSYRDGENPQGVFTRDYIDIACFRGGWVRSPAYDDEDEPTKELACYVHCRMNGVELFDNITFDNAVDYPWSLYGDVILVSALRGSFSPHVPPHAFALVGQLVGYPTVTVLQ